MPVEASRMAFRQGCDALLRVECAGFGLVQTASKPDPLRLFKF